ncbi:MAG: hypothetical protein H7Y07_01875, partial [Pyrinomonadaceae bacterium]|nr:hypothetical protein [Sphingobacteriaceae bacterium]
SQVLLSRSDTKELQTDTFWKSFSSSQQDSIKKFVSLGRFYNIKDDNLGGRPNNYYGVALLMAATNYKLGIDKDKKTIDFLFQKCLDVLKKSNGFLDDSRKFTGSFDRYNHEFLRYLWEASVLIQDKPMQRQLKPLVIQSAKLWWDLFSVDMAHSSLWGRSRQNSWDDTFEQVAFFAKNPELSPAGKTQLTSAYILAYNYYLQNEYNLKTHLNRMLDFGRGTYSYAGRNRIFGYTLGTFSKLSASVRDLSTALEHSKIKQVSTTLTLPDVSRFHTFRDLDRTYGVWAYRKNNKSFILPVVGNNFSSDYLPAIFGIPGIETPVSGPALNMVPLLELENGVLLSTAQGSDSVILVPGSNKINFLWRRLSTAKGELHAPSIQANVTWQLDDNLITYKLELVALEDLNLRSFKFCIPTYYPAYDLQTNALVKDNSSLQINYISDFTLTKSVEATQNRDVGKGAFHALPLLMKIQGDSLRLEKNKVYKFNLSIKTTN